MSPLLLTPPLADVIMGNWLEAFFIDEKSINKQTSQVDGGMRIDEANTEIGLHLMGRIPKQEQQIKYRDMKIGLPK